ncbi:hypothetical protein Tco_0827464, partial [Tanacetum coccineum]
MLALCGPLLVDEVDDDVLENIQEFAASWKFQDFAIWRCILMLNKGDASGKLYVVLKARHILCEKQVKINEAYKKLQNGWLSNGDKVPPAEFAK